MIWLFYWKPLCRFEWQNRSLFLINKAWFVFERCTLDLDRFQIYKWISPCSFWSGLESYTGKNTRQHETRVKHDTTRYNKSTTQHNTNKTRDNTSTIWCNTSTTRANTSTNKARAAKIGLCISLFVIELHFFLISFRNS